jgi:hypothetical protein
MADADSDQWYRRGSPSGDEHARGLMRSTRLTLLLAGALLPVSASAQQWRTLESARQLTSTDQTQVTLTFAGGKFELRPLPGKLLYQMQLHYDEQQTDAVHSFDASEHHLMLGLEKANMSWRALKAMKKDESGSMTVGLNPSVPLDLEVNLGGAQGDLELGGMRLKSLKLHFGLVGSTVKFSTPNQTVMDELSVDVGLGGVQFEDLGNANASVININGGMDGVSLEFGDNVTHNVKINAAVAFGGLKIQVPESVGVSVQADTKLASFKPAGFTKMNGAWFTPNWNQTSVHVTIVATAALGSLEVHHSDP